MLYKFNNLFLIEMRLRIEYNKEKRKEIAKEINKDMELPINQVSCIL